MSTSYSYRFMPDSPEGREIRELEGEAGEIIRRGRQIERLGRRMQKAATTLQLLADGQVGQGESLDAVRDQAAEVHEDLYTAGLRYEPSGTALRTYGQAVSNVKWSLNQAVRDCVEAWEAVQTRASSVDDAGDTPEDPDGGTSARQNAEADANRKLDAAEAEWLEAAKRFDGHYDTWDEAYDDALEGLEDANRDGVKDGFWDDALPVLEFIVEVLEVVGVVLLVAALIVGGPLVAVLATAAALITLAATIVLFAKGRKNGMDLGLAIVGVIPFGKLGRVFAAAGEGTALARMGKPIGLFLGFDDVSALRTHIGRIGADARTAWNAGDNLVPYANISVVSQMVQEGKAGWRYVAQNARVTDSADMFLGRLWGVGDSVAGASGTATGIGDIVFGSKAPWAQAVQITDFVTGEVGEASDERLVDSWR
ncbi:hypothetical protein [Agromyces marinus]|uniref:Uncharacterized protein n=1 Tax=Agromyces marinus TaxID=1389020 RepID=A0ABM8H436_9MICO|nr:hypothetical protein [Agromyces marinus]UIP59462.1 hypothetical protein DSM26151_23690 [Agromyces marinus]BDZ55493.1 hypothetical protein GCM10025870_25660 [Agromyces marinus]